MRQLIILAGRRFIQYAAIECRADVGQCDAGGVVLIRAGRRAGGIRAGEQIEQAAVETPGAAAARLVNACIDGIRQGPVTGFARLRLTQVDLPSTAGVVHEGAVDDVEGGCTVTHVHCRAADAGLVTDKSAVHHHQRAGLLVGVHGAATEPGHIAGKGAAADFQIAPLRLREH